MHGKLICTICRLEKAGDVVGKGGSGIKLCKIISKNELFYTEEELSEVSQGIPRRNFQGMKELLDAGLIEAGKGVITRTLRSGGSMAADLREDGQIVCSVRGVTSHNPH